VAQPQPALLTNQAFVVQFRAQPSGASRGWEGRVEHVVSGQWYRYMLLPERATAQRGRRCEATAPQRQEEEEERRW